MKNKWPVLIIMWLVYGVLEEYIPILSHDIVSLIPIIVTICLVFDYYPKDIFSKSRKLEKSVLKKVLLDKKLQVNEQLCLILNGNKYENIDVYYGDERICSLKDFEDKYPHKYDSLLTNILESNYEVMDIEDVEEVKKEGASS